MVNNIKHNIPLNYVTAKLNGFAHQLFDVGPHSEKKARQACSSW